MLDQSFQDFEIIVVDDASTDNTKEVVHSFNDGRISYKRRAENFGNDTRPKNEGIRSSSGEYIAFLDDDNVMRKDHLQSLYNVMSKSNVDLVYGDRFIYENETPLSIGIYHDFDPYLLLRRNYIDTSDVLVRKSSLLELGGFDERYKKYIDWNMWVRMAKAGMTFLRVPGIITDYHVYTDSKSNRKEDEKEFCVPAWDPFDCEVVVGKKAKPKVAIFSITYDRLEYTKQCFESLYKTAGYPFTHFIVDNGSTDGTVDYLQHNMSDTKKLILNTKNKGISVASNQAISAIVEGRYRKDAYASNIAPHYDIIVKVDNDCLFLTDGWLKRMVELWESNHMMAYSCSIQGLRDNPGGSPRVDYGKVKGEFVGVVRHLGGICVFADAKAYDHFKWDETSPLHGVQDMEFSQHLLKSGYRMAYLENYIAEHIDGTEGQEKKYPEYFKRRKLEKQIAPDINSVEHWDEVYSKEKDSDPNFRDDVLSFKSVYKYLGSGSVLDVGCGSGYMLSYFEKQNPNLKLFGCDISEEGLKITKTRTKAECVVGNILKLPYEDVFFDNVVSTEVLEHIVDIKTAAREVCRVLKPGGISVHMMPYRDFIPSPEHVREYDEESITDLFTPYLKDIKTEVIEHPEFQIVKDGKKVQCKLLLVMGVKK